MFYRNPKILRWIIASMEFWCEIQNGDGSFDEHYPNEHSFGATAWSLHAVLESYNIMNKEMDAYVSDMIYEAILRAAKFLARSEEPRILANHQAIAAAVLLELAQRTSEKLFLAGAASRLNRVLSCQSNEGWFTEYDGADLGYLTTTITFLTRIYRRSGEERILRSIRKGIDFASYFVYPDCSFGAGVGSRHTEHFHPYGFEVMANRIPLAAAVADKILEGMSNKKVITPSAMDDKYFMYQVAEYIQSYLEASPRRAAKPRLPFERQEFVKHFPHSGMLIVNKRYYAVIATRKGCILRVFDKESQRPLLIDSGFVGLTTKGELVTTQWLDGSSKIRVNASSACASGAFHKVRRESLTASKMVLSRLALLSLAWHRRATLEFKKAFIDRLIWSAKRTRIKFRRTVMYEDESFHIEDTIGPVGTASFKSLALVSQFYPRYVPASEYFHSNDIVSDDIILTKYLTGAKGGIVVKRTVESGGSPDMRIRILYGETDATLNCVVNPIGENPLCVNDNRRLNCKTTEFTEVCTDYLRMVSRDNYA